MSCACVRRLRSMVSRARACFSDGQIPRLETAGPPEHRIQGRCAKLWETVGERKGVSLGAIGELLSEE